MTTFAVLPDLDAALVSFLKLHADLVPLHGGRVGTTLPPGGLTSIRVANLGGGMPWPWLVRNEFQVECWGGSTNGEVQANLLARTVEAVIFEMASTIDNIITSVVTLAHFASPDLVSNRFRYILQVQLEATP